MSLTNNDASIVMGMVARKDNDHNIAAWFGVNQGRIAEVKAGSHGQVQPAPAAELPPKGAPGLKGRRLRGAVEKAVALLAQKEFAAAEETLVAALKKYNTNEA